MDYGLSLEITVKAEVGVENLKVKVGVFFTHKGTQGLSYLGKIRGKICGDIPEYIEIIGNTYFSDVANEVKVNFYVSRDTNIDEMIKGITSVVVGVTGRINYDYPSVNIRKVICI